MTIVENNIMQGSIFFLFCVQIKTLGVLGTQQSEQTLKGSNEDKVWEETVSSGQRQRLLSSPAALLQIYRHESEPASIVPL